MTHLAFWSQLNCLFQMEDIRVPMSRGTMEDISQEGEQSSQVDGSEGGAVTDSMSSQGAKRIYEREARIMVDYSNLDDDLKDVCLLTCYLFL